MEENTKTTKTVKPVKIPEDTLIIVKSGYYGTLYFLNKKTGQMFKWAGCGDIQLLTMSDLVALRGDCQNFFKNQLIIIVGVNESSDCKASTSDIYKALAVSHFYKDIIDPDNFDVVCSWSADEISSRVKMLSSGAKDNLIVALNKFIQDGTLDSRKKIKEFEKALDCELLENK